MWGRLLSACHKQSLLWAPAATTGTEVTSQILFNPICFHLPITFRDIHLWAWNFSVLCLCPRRALDSCILGGRAVRGIIFPFLPWQGQWDNICKVSWKSFFSLKRWIQPTAGSGWLRNIYKHMKNILLSLKSMESDRKWFGIAHPDHPNPAQAMPHFWGAPLPRHHPRDWDRTGNWDISKSVKFSGKNVLASLILACFLF